MSSSLTNNGSRPGGKSVIYVIAIGREWRDEMGSFNMFGDYLKYHRTKLGVSQEDLAKRVLMDRSYLSVLERHGNPTFAIMKDIVEKGLRMELDDFYDVKEPDLREPAILVEMQKDTFRDKLDEFAVGSAGIPLPIISEDKIFKSEELQPGDVDGYVVLDKTLLSGKADPKTMRVVVIRKSNSLPFPFVIVDLSNRLLEEGGTYLIDRGGLRMREAHNNEKNVVFTTSFEEGKPDAVFGRARDAVKVFGRVIYACQEL